MKNFTSSSTPATSRVPEEQNRPRLLHHAALALLFGALVAAIGCAGEIGAVRNFSEAKVPSPPVAPRISQVALPSDIFGTAGTDEGALSGRSVAVGDFDGDGHADVAVGMPGADNGRGAVGIIYGDADGMDLDNPDLSTRTRLTEGAVVGFGFERNGDQLGYAVAAGDFDGDGFADLVMSAPFRHVGDETGAGRVYVLYGSAERGAAGFVRRIDRITQNGAGRDEADDHFGMALAVGDFNGDGYQDLAIGAPDEDDNSNNRANSGAVFIRYGSAGGLTSTDYHYVTAATRSVTTGENPTEAGERFGACLAAGPLHTPLSGRVDDLVVGAPDKDVLIYSASAGFRNVSFANCGKVYVYEGRVGINELSHRIDIIPNTWPPGITGFGSALAIGDFDGDGNYDLAAGAPNAGPDNDHTGGRVFIMMHNPVNGSVGQRAFPDVRNTQYQRQSDQVLTESPIAKIENGDRYGYALASADFNDDGFWDLAVGAPWEDWDGVNDTGLVFVFVGASDGLAPSFGCDYYFMDQSPRGANELGDRFGYALATGDVNGDGRPDLVIGAPYENRPNLTDCGAVFLAKTSTAVARPFDGAWSGQVTGDNGTSATLTLFLCDRDALVSGSGSLGGDIEKNACDQTVTLGREADLRAQKAGANSTTASGQLVNFELPSDVRGDALVDLSLSNDHNTLTATIRVRNVRVNVPGLGWIDPPFCNADMDIMVTLMRVP